MNVKLYLKRDNSSEFSRYIVLDELGVEKYSIVGRHLASGERMYILDGEKKLMKIKDTKLYMLRSFYISQKSDAMRILIAYKGNDISVTFHGICWHISGDVLGKAYDILDIDNSVVASVSKSYSSGTQLFEININNEEKELFCIAGAVCVNSIATVHKMAAQTT